LFFSALHLEIHVDIQICEYRVYCVFYFVDELQNHFAYKLQYLCTTELFLNKTLQNMFFFHHCLGKRLIGALGDLYTINRELF